MKIASPFESHAPVSIGPVPLAQPVLATWVIMAALGLCCWAMQRRLRIEQPAPWQVALELFVEAVLGQIREVMGSEAERHLPLIGTLFAYLLIANWSSLIPGVEPPTASIETDAALALIVAGATILNGSRALGPFGYLRSFATPSLVMLPINLVEFVARCVSLAVRLFGNVMSGVVLIGVLLAVAGLLLPIPMMALELLTGAIQAYIFAALATVFIGSAAGEHITQEGGTAHELDPSR